MLHNKLRILMNNLSRKVFALSICLCSALISFADDIVTVSGAKCKIDSSSKTAVVIGPTNSSTTSVTIPYRVYSTSSGEYVPVVGIADEAFLACANLTKLDFYYDNIDNGDYAAFKRIGERAFMNCTGLVEIGDYLPDEIEEFADGAFIGCTNLKSITFPQSLRFLGSSAFEGCTSLETVNISPDIVMIGHKAFSQCSALTGFYCNSSSLWKIGDNAFENCTSMTNAEFQSASLTDIASCTFSECKNLRTVKMPNTVTNIGYMAFQRCESLTTINLPSSLQTLGVATFAYSGLTSIELPNTLTCISALTFSYSNSLSSVKLPENLTSIDMGAFSGCSNITSIMFPKTLTDIGGLAFMGCTSLNYVTLPNSIKNLGEMSFYGCKNLTDLDTGCSLENIPSTAFRNCDKLYTLTLGPSIKTLTEQCFYSSKNLQTIRCYAENPPSVADDAFAEGVLSKVTLRIPTSLLDAYQKSEPWKDCNVIYNMLYCNEKCAKPVISIIDGKIIAECSTPGAQCNITYYMTTNSEEVSSDMTPERFASLLSNMFSGALGSLDKSTGYGIGCVAPTFKLKVIAYASAEGFFTSETVTQTFDLKDIQNVSGLAGDMDGDGQLSVKDVTKLVDKVLNK